MQTLHEEEQETSELLTQLDRAVQLPVWLVNMLKNPPARGEGLHQWLYKVARQLHPHLVPASITGLLAALCPEAEEGEIADAVFNSEATAWQPRFGPWTKARLDWLECATTAPTPAHGHTPAPAPARPAATAPATQRARKPATRKWPLPDLAAIEQIALIGTRLADLQARSTFNFTGLECYTAWILQQIFPPDALLCLGLDHKSTVTMPLSEWLTRHVEIWQFIVPSPMTALRGLTVGAHAHEGNRSLANTGERRFLVVECDFSEYAKDGKTETRYAGLIRRLRARNVSVADMCAAVVVNLAELLPLVMVVNSGGKSLHGWFYVAEQEEADLLDFMSLAVSLGADHATWTRCQFVRLPGGARTNGVWPTVENLNAEGEIGVRQTVEYFNAKGGLWVA